MPGNTFPHLVMLSAPASPLAEAFRVLRANLERSAVPQSLRTVLVTSPTAEEKRHLLAANLALAFAEGASKTIAVDADLHHPQLHSLFSLHETPGLLQCLAEDAGWQQALQDGPLPGLSLMTAGGLHPVPAPLEVCWLL